MYLGGNHGRKFRIGGGCLVALPGPMSVLSQNYRGLGNPRTVNALERIWKKEAPICVFLMEKKISTDQLSAKKQNWDYNQGLMVSSDGRSGGLALMWKSDTKVHVKNFSRCFIDAHMFCETTGLCWRLTGFYGHHETSKREETWTLLRSLGQSNHLPWLCVGDFNEITS